MFSVYNDAINSTVYMADHEGQITTYPIHLVQSVFKIL